VNNGVFSASWLDVGIEYLYPSRGVGTIVALTLPYVVWISLSWIALFVAWHLLGLPWGL
jgi:aminobenzoyl-glutamate transport protein